MSTTVPASSSVPAQSAPPGAEASTAPASEAPPAAARSTVVDAVISGGCVLSATLVAIGFALDPAATHSSARDIVEAVASAPDRFFAAMYLAALGLAMLACVGIAVMRLVPGRGRGLATAGGLLVVLGAASAAAGIFMYGAVLSTLIANESVDTVVGLQEGLEDSSRIGIAFMIGFPGFFLGLLLCAAALARSRAVPLAVPVLLAVGMVGTMAAGDLNRVVSVTANAILALGCASIGVLAWQRRPSAAR